MLVVLLPVPGFTVVNGWLVFHLIFFKVKPKTRGRSFPSRETTFLQGRLKSLLWPQRDACCVPSLDQWVNLWGVARKAWWAFLIKKRDFWSIFQKLSWDCDLRLPQKLVWGTLWSVQWWYILFSKFYSLALLMGPSTLSKSYESHQWNCDHFVDEK